MNCTGKVLETGNKTARVRIESTACDKCHACGFASLSKKKSMDVSALNEVGAFEGDNVALELSGRRVMSASAILFLIPFFGFIAGFLLGYYGAWHLFGSQYRTLVSIVLAFALLGLSYYPVHLLGDRKIDFEFVILSVVKGEEPSPPPHLPGSPQEKGSSLPQ